MAETPHFLKALGRQSLPAQIAIDSRSYRLERMFKNDFFAVTALYVCERQTNDDAALQPQLSSNVFTLTPTPPPERERGLPDKVILKVSRQASLFGFPMRWVGKILAAKERAVLRQLQDLPGIPRLVAEWGPTGIARQYIEGRHLARRMHVPDDFHPQLRALIGEMHQRGMAYVDLEKAENVLVGEDGRPYLFDFQIAWYLPRRWGGELLPARLIRRWLQRGDLYHLVKLQRRTRRDQLTDEALAASYRKPLVVRVYRALSYPFTWVRRRILQWIDPRRAPGERGRIMGDCP